MLTYIQGVTRPEISMTTHQAAMFVIGLKLSHERAIHGIGCYPKGTSEKGFTSRPKKSKGLECYVDADFVCRWDKADASNPQAVMSRI